MNQSWVLSLYKAFSIFYKGIAVFYALFQIYTATTVPLVAMLQRSIHLMFAMLLLFLAPRKSPSGSDRMPGLIDVLLAATATVSMLYMVFEFGEIAPRIGSPNRADVVMGVLAIVVVLEGTRRSIGLAMPIVTVGILLYVFLGNYLPGRLGHVGYDIERVSGFLYMSTEGIFGIPVGVSATVVAVFIIFGVLLRKSGAGDFIINFSMALIGGVRGGPAKVAVVASSMFGTISGSVVANVVGTGSFTIPMMKRHGFSPEFAGAVEATASTGGMIMPPVMGTVAFLIAEIVGVPYWTIVVTAVIPALLYYTSLFFAIDLHAARLGMKGLARSELPSFRTVLRDGWVFIIPIGFFIYLLGGVKYSATKAGILACGAIFLTALFQRRVSVRWMIDVLVESGDKFISVAMVMACSGIIIGGFTLTGFGMKLSSLLVQLSKGELLPLLFITMVACLILGMGVTTTASYIILAVLVAPALVDMGVPVLAAHFFVFYIGSLANVTPPVALGSYAAAAVAGGNPSKTGWLGIKIALPGLIVPYLFVYNPALIMQGDVVEILWSVVTGGVGVYMMAVATQGHFLRPLRPGSRIFAFAIGCLLVVPELITDAIGLALFAMFCIKHRLWAKKQTA